MAFDLHLNIPEDSPAGLAVQRLVSAEHVTPEQAVTRILTRAGEVPVETEDAAIQKLFTPELLTQIDAAHADMRAGNRVTLDELDASLAATKARWLAANPS